MVAKDRFVALTSTALLVASTFFVLVTPAAVATSGRDSPALAVDGGSGPFQGLFDNSVYVERGPPVVEDWYKMSVKEGDIFQASLVMNPGGRITVYHQDAMSQIATQQVRDPNQIGAGFTPMDLIIWKTEQIYVKISPNGQMGAPSRQYYNLAMRTYTAPELGATSTFTSAPAADTIHGWDYLFYLDANSIWLPMLYESDFFWVNASDIAGPTHRNYRIQMSYTCQTAIMDIFLYQVFDQPNQKSELINHSLASQRRENRNANIRSTDLEQVDFAPVLYDGKYLLEVYAAENGTFALLDGNSVSTYNYTLSVTTTGGFSKDNNDLRDQGPWVNISLKVNGHLDGRDDSGDWYQFPLFKGDQVSGILVTLIRDNNEVVTWGQRYRAVVFGPNGTAIQDVTNWGFNNNQPYFNPFLTVPGFVAPANGSYGLLLLAADGGLNSFQQASDSGWVGHNWVDYEVNFQLPNRPPVQIAPLPDLSMNEEGSATIDLGLYFRDPEAKFGYPAYGVGSSLNFTFQLVGTNLSATPKTDWNGREAIMVSVRDDVPANSKSVVLNLTVDAVNDAPRIWPGAPSNWTVVNIGEDTETTVALRSIFFDIDDIDLNFTAGGVSGSHIAVAINPTSQIATITPELNWNGQTDIHWTATDGGSLTNEFTTTLKVTPVNDPPRATDRRLDRIVFNEGSEYTLDLSSDFYDLDGDVLSYYGYLEDPLVAQYVRINNSLLVPQDPHLRIYVLDRYRADYFTDGPVQIKFGVRDPTNNYDPVTGQNLVLEKATFLEILNVNDPPFVDDFSPTTTEVASTEWHETDSITFSVTSVKDPDNEVTFFYKWFVNGDEIPQETGATYLFKTVLDATRPGQFAEGNYTVSVQVFDASGAKATREPSWNFQVHKTNRVPTVEILKPTAATFEEGAFIDFQALANDEDPEDVGRLVIEWTYTDGNGQSVTMGTGDRLRAMLDPGVYTVSAKSKDGIATSTKEVTVTVTPHTFNTPGFDFGTALLGLGMAAGAVGLLTKRRRRGGFT
jgi:hypothetical protein